MTAVIKQCYVANMTIETAWSLEQMVKRFMKNSIHINLNKTKITNFKTKIIYLVIKYQTV